MKLTSFDYPASLNQHLKACQKLTLEHLKLSHQIGRQIKAHFFSKQGKQLRALLVLMCAKHTKRGFTQDIITAAAALELLHNASLVHDDVLDQAKKRRGLETVSSKWDNKTAILFGDLLLSESYHLCHQLKNKFILKSLATATKEVCEGEILQNFWAFKTPFLNRTQYYTIIRKKTASLFESAAETGGLAGNFTDNDVSHLKSFGRHFGLAFQIFDDCLDLMLSTKLSGKSSFRDLAEGKITLPILHLMTRLRGQQLQWLREHIFALKSADKKSVYGLLRQHRSIEYCQATVIRHLKLAQKHLEHVVDLEYKPVLINWVQSLSGFMTM